MFEKYKEKLNDSMFIYVIP